MSDKSNTSWKAKKIEKNADSYIPYKYYRSSTGHQTIKLKYTNVLRYVLFTLCLLEKANMMAVELDIAVDTAEVFKTTKRSHVLAGFNIVDENAKSPSTNNLMSQYKSQNPKDGGFDKSGFHKNDLIACVPLHFCVGK